MITLSYLKSQLFIENIKRIDDLRRDLHSLIIPRENELRLRWNTRIEEIYYDLSLYDLSFTRKQVAAALADRTKKTVQKDKFSHAWREARDYIEYQCFYPAHPLTETEIFTLYRILNPQVSVQPFSELAEYVRYSQSEDHPVTRAALLQSIIYNLKPFPTFNEPFSHLCFQLSLHWSGWDLRELISIEEQYFHDRAYYKELITNTYSSGNLTQWIEYVSEALGNQIDKVISTIDTKQTIEEPTQEKFILNDRQKEILAFLDKPDSEITNRKLQKMSKISQMTAARDLAKLVELNLIFPRGKGRAVSYTKTI